MPRTLSSQVFSISPDSLDYPFHCLTVLKRKSLLLTSRWNLFWFSLWCFHSPFHHTQLQRPVFPLLDDPLPDAVKLLLCPLEVSSSPNWTSPISSAALTGQCSSPTTTLLIQPNILGCTAQSCLHCSSVRQSSSPLSPVPDVTILSFSLLRWRILLQFLLNFMSPFLHPV